MILKKLRKQSVSNIFWWIVFLCFFNISADVRMSVSKTLPVHAPFNEQESIVELVVEKILGFTDAIPEGEDSDSEDLTKTNSLVDLFTPGHVSLKSNLKSGSTTKKLIIPHPQDGTLDCCYSIHTPPPEA